MAERSTFGKGGLWPSKRQRGCPCSHPQVHARSSLPSPKSARIPTLTWLVLSGAMQAQGCLLTAGYTTAFELVFLHVYVVSHFNLWFYFHLRDKETNPGRWNNLSRTIEWWGEQSLPHAILGGGSLPWSCRSRYHLPFLESCPLPSAGEGHQAAVMGCGSPSRIFLRTNMDIKSLTLHTYSNMSGWTIWNYFLEINICQNGPFHMTQLNWLFMVLAQELITCNRYPTFRWSFSSLENNCTCPFAWGTPRKQICSWLGKTPSVIFHCRSIHSSGKAGKKHI